MTLPPDAKVTPDTADQTDASRRSAAAHHVVIITLNRTPSEPATAYAEFLVSKGVDVEVIVVDRNAADAVTVPCRVHPLVPDELRIPLRRLESIIVRRLPGGLPRRAAKHAFAQLRPWSLARQARPLLRRIDLSRAERIVASDAGAVTLGWRMARRAPRAVATTALDRKPYSHL